MRLLLAIDLNDGPEALVAEASEWAKRLGARLDLAYVDDVYLVQDPEIRGLLDPQWPRVRERQNERLEALRQSMPPEIRGELLYLSGRPSDEIAAAARGRDAVLIGTHGRRGLSHAMLGSVAERVVRLSPVPVLVLRQPTSP